MSTRQESGKKESLWLWDGEAEYEGDLLTLDEPHFTASLREVRRWRLATGSPGRSIPMGLLERHREFCRRVCFGQSPAIQLGSLLEVRIETVQSSRDRHFDYVFAGIFAAVSDGNLEALSQLSSDEAVAYLDSRRRGFPPPSVRRRSGDSATGSLGI
jgi:hypothetical protein